MLLPLPFPAPHLNLLWGSGWRWPQHLGCQAALQQWVVYPHRQRPHLWAGTQAAHGQGEVKGRGGQPDTMLTAKEQRGSAWPGLLL